MKNSRILKTILGNQELIAVDCGAAGGVLPHWNSIKDQSKFLLFEPDPRSFSDLQKMIESEKYPSRWKIETVGVSETGGRKILFLFNGGTGSSLLPPDTENRFFNASDPYVFPIREIEVDTITVKDALIKHGFPHVDLAKLDVQGAELNVLRGFGESNLKSLLVLEVEVIVMPTYSQQGTIEEIFKLLRGYGLEMFDLRKWPAYWSDKGVDTLDYCKILDVHKATESVLHQVHEIDFLFFSRSSRVYCY